MYNERYNNNKKYSEQNVDKAMRLCGRKYMS